MLELWAPNGLNGALESRWLGILNMAHFGVPSLKLTIFSPENRPSQKERIVFQPSIFRGYVSFREGIYVKFLGCKPFILDQNQGFFSLGMNMP